MRLRKRQQAGWAIASDFSSGLYVGWSQTRGEAIAQHVHDVCSLDDERPSQFFYGALDELQRKQWAKCKARGDYAVRVTITWSARA